MFTKEVIRTLNCSSFLVQKIYHNPIQCNSQHGTCCIPQENLAFVSLPQGMLRQQVTWSSISSIANTSPCRPRLGDRIWEWVRFAKASLLPKPLLSRSPSTLLSSLTHSAHPSLPPTFCTYWLVLAGVFWHSEASCSPQWPTYMFWQFAFYGGQKVASTIIKPYLFWLCLMSVGLCC